MENENQPEAKPDFRHQIVSSLLALDFSKLYKPLVQGVASWL
jgi:hypothetical protein